MSDESKTQTTMDALDALAEQWLKDSPEVVKALWEMPFNLPTEEFESQGRALVLRMIKNAWKEGAYAGNTALNAENARLRGEREATNAWVESARNDYKKLADHLYSQGVNVWADTVDEVLATHAREKALWISQNEANASENEQLRRNNRKLFEAIVTHEATIAALREGLEVATTDYAALAATAKGFMDNVCLNSPVWSTETRSAGEMLRAALQAENPGTELLERLRRAESELAMLKGEPNAVDKGDGLTPFPVDTARAISLIFGNASGGAGRAEG
jgi:hypothetical protein